MKSENSVLSVKSLWWSSAVLATYLTINICSLLIKQTFYVISLYSCFSASFLFNLSSKTNIFCLLKADPLIIYVMFYLLRHLVFCNNQGVFYFKKLIKTIDFSIIIIVYYFFSSTVSGSHPYFWDQMLFKFYATFLIIPLKSSLLVDVNLCNFLLLKMNFLYL